MEQITNGIWKENPVFILLMGLCPALAVTVSAMNGLGMGIVTLAVLVLSNLLLSLLSKSIPEKSRLTASLVISAALVAVAELVVQVCAPGLYDALGIYLPLVVVNCLILSRGESAVKSEPALAACDGIGMGLGFTLALTVIGLVRELFGVGTVFGVQIMPGFYQPMSILVKAPGAFLVFALILVILNGANVRLTADESAFGFENEKEENA